MEYVVNHSVLSGQTVIPGNKSGTARGIVFGSLASGRSVLYNPLNNLDSYSIVYMMRALGAEIDTSDNAKWIIDGVDGKPKQPACVLDAQNSGTGFYFALATASLIDGYSGRYRFFDARFRYGTDCCAGTYKRRGIFNARCQFTMDDTLFMRMCFDGKRRVDS